MASLEKTSRLFNFLLWLTKAGKEGISIDYIIREYDISKKTLLRDLRELNKISDLIQVEYDKQDGRVKAHSQITAESQENDDEKDPINIFHQIGRNPQENSDYIAHVTHIAHQSPLQLKTNEINHLIDCCLHAKPLTLSHQTKQRTVLPLLFCHYGERWYLISVIGDSSRIRKFRLDKITNIKIQKFKKTPDFGEKFSTPQKVQKNKHALLEMINQSHNIFVDLNASEKINVTFRFYFSLDFIQKEIKHFNLLDDEKSDEDQVHTIEIIFRGFAEAKTFMNLWLGHFSILSPEWLADQYIGEIEDALDSLKV